MRGNRRRRHRGPGSAEINLPSFLGLKFQTYTLTGTDDFDEIEPMTTVDDIDDGSELRLSYPDYTHCRSLVIL